MGEGLRLGVTLGLLGIAFVLSRTTAFLGRRLRTGGSATGAGWRYRSDRRLRVGIQVLVAGLVAVAFLTVLTRGSALSMIERLLP